MIKKILPYMLLLVLVLESMYVGYRLPKSQEYPVIDPRLAPFLDEFVQEGKSRGIIVDPNQLGVMVFTDLPDGENGIAGFCNSAGFLWAQSGIERSAVVLIDKDYMDQALDSNDYTFKALVFHELGHCLLYRPHDDPAYLTIMTSLPIGSIILPYWEMSERYKQTWKAQLDDLFLRPIMASPAQEFLIYDFLAHPPLAPAPAPRTSPSDGNVP